MENKPKGYITAAGFDWLLPLSRRQSERNTMFSIWGAVRGRSH
jgi:hypothetical protein